MRPTRIRKGTELWWETKKEHEKEDVLIGTNREIESD